MCPHAAIRNLSLLGVIIGFAVSVPAAQLKEARVTQVVKDVKLLPTDAAARPAAVSDEVRDGTAVRTGVDSRSELKFTDQTLARLGANTIFSFSEGTRNLNLQDGAMLLRVPKGAGGAKINSSAVTAAITGTTVMVETHASTKKNKNSYYKFIVLEGTARLYLPGRLGESTLVKAGQMIIMRTDSKMIPEPVDVDIQKITESSLLITGFGPLGSEALIAFEKTKQNEQKNSGQLYETSLAIFGAGTNVVLADPNTVDVAVSAESNAAQSPTPTPTPTATPTTTPTPTPTPSKFGTLSPISSPVPYVITSRTTITTDPSITTNGVTDFGKIYRDSTQDGLPSAYFFGSSSNFDSTGGFDPHYSTSTHTPIAAFKFQSLELAGVPNIDIADGADKLALIAINSITSAQPGGVWNFPALSEFLLATQNGSISLGSEISFQNIPTLFFYARGTSSDLTLSSAISGATDTTLIAQRDVNIDGTTIASQSLVVTAGADVNIGANTAVTVNANDVTLLVDNSGGNLTSGGNITLRPAGNPTFGGDVILTVDNSNGGHIASSAGISLVSGGNLSSGSLIEFINDRNGSSIDGNATLSLNVNSAVTASDLSIEISMGNDGNGAGSVGAMTLISANAASISASGFFDTFISANGGARIQGDAINTVNVSGDLTAQQGILVGIADTGFGGNGSFVAGSHIGGNAIVILNARNIITPSTATGVPGTDTMALEASIYPNVSGTVGGDAFINVSATQNIRAPGTTLFWIANGNYQNLGPGMIGGNAVVNVSASSIFTGDLLAQILNYGGAAIGQNALVNVTANTLTVNGNIDSAIDNSNGGMISGSAATNFSIAGDFATTNGAANFRIWNFGGGLPSPAGSISGDATITLAAANLITPAGSNLSAEILNQNNGSIGGSAIMDFIVSGALNTPAARFTIDNIGGTITQDARIGIIAGSLSVGGNLDVTIDNNANGGTIGGAAVIDMNSSGAVTITNNATVQILGDGLEGSAAINVNGGSWDVGGTFLGLISDDGTITLSNAAIHADVVKAGAFGSNGTLRIGGGSISANTLLHLYAPGSNGTIDFVSNVTLNNSSAAAVIAANTVTIENGVVVTIAGATPANVFANVPNYTGSGGNGSTLGIFGGAGATTQPLAQAPPFDNAPAVRAAIRHRNSAISNGRRAPAIEVTDSSQLGTLLNNATLGPDGKVRISPPGHSRNPSVHGSTRTMAAELHRSVDAKARSSVLAFRSQ
jgi:hypothetical protein